MAGHVRKIGAGGYLKGDRVRLRDNCQSQKLYCGVRAWRVVDFKGARIGVLPEIRHDPQFRNRSGLPAKKSFKFYVTPDQLIDFPPCRPKNTPRLGAVFGVYAARSASRGAQAAGIISQPEQEPDETPGSLLRRSPAAAACEPPARISRDGPILQGFPADCICWKCSCCRPAQHCRCGRLGRCQAITCLARHC
jgi:hypothetical protein